MYNHVHSLDSVVNSACALLQHATSLLGDVMRIAKLATVDGDKFHGLAADIARFSDSGACEPGHIEAIRERTESAEIAIATAAVKISNMLEPSYRPAGSKPAFAGDASKFCFTDIVLQFGVLLTATRGYIDLRDKPIPDADRVLAAIDNMRRSAMECQGIAVRTLEGLNQQHLHILNLIDLIPETALK